MRYGSTGACHGASFSRLRDRGLLTSPLHPTSLLIATITQPSFTNSSLSHLLSLSHPLILRSSVKTELRSVQRQSIRPLFSQI